VPMEFMKIPHTERPVGHCTMLVYLAGYIAKTLATRWLRKARFGLVLRRAPSQAHEEFSCSIFFANPGNSCLSKEWPRQHEQFRKGGRLFSRSHSRCSK